MDYSTFTQTLEQSQPSTETDAFCFYQAFEQVSDGRKKRGVRYQLGL